MLILALIGIYRISDVVMGIMANPFYVDMGYSEAEVASVSKVFGVIMTLAGAFVGGVISMRIGVMRVLMLGAVLSAASNLLFAGPRPVRIDLRRQRRQPGRRHRLGGLHRLSVQLDQCQLLRHAIRLVQLDDDAAAQVAGRLFRRIRRAAWLCELLLLHGRAGPAGPGAGRAGRQDSWQTGDLSRLGGLRQLLI